jgi:PAS domain S-box-containing protein
MCSATRLLWSDENYRIFGVPKGTRLSYETFLAIVHPEDRAVVDRQWMAALQGEPYDIEHRLVVGNAVKWVRERAELEVDADGHLLGGFGITQDISDRKQSEKHCARAKKRFGRRTKNWKTPSGNEPGPWKTAWRR